MSQRLARTCRSMGLRRWVPSSRWTSLPNCSSHCSRNVCWVRSMRTVCQGIQSPMAASAPLLSLSIWRQRPCSRNSPVASLMAHQKSTIALLSICQSFVG